MSKEMEFFIYLIENYAYQKHTTVDKIFDKLSELNILDKVFNSYKFYYIERLDNAYKDTDGLTKDLSFGKIL